MLFCVVVLIMYEVDYSPEALILAAGEGSRLRKYARQKVLQPIAKIPVLGRILRGLKEAGIERVHIVVGYEGDNIREEIGENYCSLDINYITAQKWEKGNLYSFMAAKDVFQKNFILCMGDHIFDPQIVKSLMNVNVEDVLILATDKTSYSLDDTKVLGENGKILNIGKKIDHWNCVDTGFFLCSPEIFAYGEEARELGSSELADCVRLVAKDGCARVLDITGKYWVDVDTKKDIDRAKKPLAEHSQKKRGASDFVAHYLNRPIENQIVHLISDSRITPNQITIFTNVLAYIVTALFFSGHLLTGAILTFVVGIVDGLDGKLARIRGCSTKLGLLEHVFDLLYEFSWLIALAFFVSRSQGSMPLVATAWSITFIAFYRFCYDQFGRTMGVSLDVYGRFERAFRRVAGRRNIYNVYILVGALLGVPFYSLIGILIHSALTATMYAYRAAVHLHAVDEKKVQMHG
jgi:choline kinase/phosphatidylglycerophosphate synthase